MSDSENNEPLHEEPVSKEQYEAVDAEEYEADLTEEKLALAEARREVDGMVEAGDDLIEGPAEVTLIVDLNASGLTPQGAVNAFILNAARRGLGGFFYEVTETNSGKRWYVREGMVVSSDDVRKVHDEASDDEPSESE